MGRILLTSAWLLAITASADRADQYRRQLKSPDPSVRFGAAVSLVTIEGPGATAAVPVLVDALMGPNRKIRGEAADALGAIGPEARSAEPALIEALKDDDRELRWCAAEALSWVDPSSRAGVPRLVEALQDPKDPERQILAAAALARCHAEVHRVVPFLIGTLKGEVPTFKGDKHLTYELFFTAVVALGDIGPQARDAVPVLTRWLQANEKLAESPAVLLAGALIQIDPSNQRAAADLRKVLPDLIMFLSDRDRGAPLFAADVLSRMGAAAQPAAPALTRALKDPNRLVRAKAAEALGAIGPRARTALPALRDARKDPDLRVRQAAAKAVNQILGSPRAPAPRRN